MTMGEVIIFPADRVVSGLQHRIQVLECRIIKLVRILQHEDCPSIVDEIVYLRDEIWRLETGAKLTTPETA